METFEPKVQVGPGKCQKVSLMFLLVSLLLLIHLDIYQEFTFL